MHADDSLSEEAFVAEEHAIESIHAAEARTREWILSTTAWLTSVSSAGAVQLVSTLRDIPVWCWLLSIGCVLLAAAAGSVYLVWPRERRYVHMQEEDDSKVVPDGGSHTTDRPTSPLNAGRTTMRPTPFLPSHMGRVFPSVRSGSTRAAPTGMLPIRAGVLANRRADGSSVSCFLVAANVTATTPRDRDVGHCDLLVFDNETVARQAVRRIGGDSSVTMPLPIKTISHVSMADAASITGVWNPPPWEAPSFRSLRFGTSSDMLLSSPPAHGPFGNPAPPLKPMSKDASWTEWVSEKQQKRKVYERAWLLNASPRDIAERQKTQLARRRSPTLTMRSLAVDLKHKLGQRGYLWTPASEPAKLAPPAPPSPPRHIKASSARTKASSASKRRAAEKKAELEAARRRAEEEAALRRRELTLIFHDISAVDVPDADVMSGSDPFATFTLVNCGGEPQMGRTPTEMNTNQPKWVGQCTVLLPAGSEAAMTKQPRLRIQVSDKDLTDADELLGEAELLLTAPSGVVERLVLKGCPNTSGTQGGIEKFADFTISFAYEISAFVTPPAVLELSDVRAFELPCDAKLEKGRRGSVKTTLVRSPYLRFFAHEVGGEQEMHATAFQPATANPVWEGFACVLRLPKGSPRPPLVCVQLCDEDAVDGSNPLATADVRLTGESGKVDATLSGRVGMRDVRVALAFELKAAST